MPEPFEIEAWGLALSLAALGLGAFVQGASGFAYGLIAIPLLIWVGLPLPAAVAVVLTTTLVQTLAGVWQFRDALVWRDARAMMVFRTAAMPVGLLLMAWLSARGVVAVKQTIVVVLLLIVLAMVVLRPKPRERVPSSWTPAVGLTSGTLSGLIGMGGPPLVLWVTAHDWPTRRSRVLLWACFLQLVPVQLALMGWRFGSPVGWSVLAGLLATPWVLGWSRLGAWMGSRWSRQRLRAVTLLLLVLTGLSSLLSPWLR